MFEMMLTIKQPVHYGYRTVHELPTPPRSSPPVVAQDFIQKPLSASSQKHSPSAQPMTAPHRGLPLPAAITLPQPPPAPSQAHQPAPGPSLHSQAPPGPSAHGQTLGALPAPPPWQGSDDSMKTWLIAKTEEEKRRQEEEKTRQESLRLEQRKIEHDMLRTSLDRGIPPPMIPVVFAGMGGGTLPQAALEFAQQYLMPHQAHQILPAQGPVSPEHRRDSQQYGGFSGSVGVPSTPGSGPAGQAGFLPYQGPSSPTRPRAHTLGPASSVGRQLEGSSLPRLRTSDMPAGPSATPSYPAHVLGPQQQQPPAQQQEQSPSIYFHHWTPPTSQASSNQPGTPSGSSKSKTSK